MIALLIWVVITLMPSFGRAQQSAPPKRVLVLYWYNKDFPGNVSFDRSFQAALQSSPAGTVEYYPEYLESDRFPGENQAIFLRDFLRQKYADRTIDVIVAAGYVTLDFLIRYRDDLFPNTPIIFLVGTRHKAEELAARPGITGIISLNTHRKTLDLTLRLHPGTEQVFIISGTLERDKKLETMAREELQGYESKVQITYLTDFSPNELIAKMRSLPERSIILYLWQQTHNGQNKVLESADVLALIAESAPVPIYGMASWHVGSGIVGGYVNTPEGSATRAAEIALRIANGERAQDIPVENAPTIPMFDWRELRRWGISEAQLPQGSVIRFKELSFWEEYKWRIIGVISLFMVQAGLIAVLLIERSRRKRAREALDDRFRFETLLSNLSADFTDLRPEEVDRKIKEGLERLVEFLGVDRGCFIKFSVEGEKIHHRHSYSVPDKDTAAEISMQEQMPWYTEQLGRGAVLNYSHLPEQLPVEAASEKQQFRDAGLKSHLAVPVLSGGSVVCAITFTTHSFHRIWSEDLIARLRLVGEIFANALMRKGAEEALLESYARIEDLAGRLIVAQEDERKHIARELHDDLNQQVAALSISLGRLERQLPNADESVHQQFNKLEARMIQLSDRIRQLSHELHSSILEHVGLSEALKLHCSEFTDREGISVTLNIQNGIGVIPTDVALCLYRVAQESLRNVAKHSGAKVAEVVLAGNSESLDLRVADYGVGFDPEVISLHRGLGLISLEERIKLLHGSFELRSQPGIGTELRVHLPLRNERVSAVSSAI
ncbi:MAG: histidine kinase [Acidobacteria bacterium]|nr:histidine kinase [Acidobacteriota bacterium]